MLENAWNRWIHLFVFNPTGVITLVTCTMYINHTSKPYNSKVGATSGVASDSKAFIIFDLAFDFMHKYMFYLTMFTLFIVLDD